jgi:hypothetical protein
VDEAQLEEEGVYDGSTHKSDSVDLGLPNIGATGNAAGVNVGNIPGRASVSGTIFFFFFSA